MPIADHIWLTVLLVAFGVGFWLFDEFSAERYEIGRDVEFGTFGMNDPERDMEGRNAYKAAREKTARYTGYLFMGVGALSGLLLLFRTL